MGKTGKIIGHIIGNIVAAFISLIVIIPLVVLFLNSFKTSAEANKMTLSLPTEPKYLPLFVTTSTKSPLV